MERMNRDIKVAENGLKTLIQNDNHSYFPSGQNTIFRFNSNSVEGQYIKEYGVIFSADLCEPCIKNKQKKKGVDAAKIDVAKHLTDAAKTFLADYGSIIGQLGADQKIMIRFSDEGQDNIIRAYGLSTSGANKTVWVDGQKNTHVDGTATIASGKRAPEVKQEITVEVAVADLKSNMAGSLSRDALLGKIKTETKTQTFEEDPQLETFTAMFHWLYQRDLSSTYFMSSRPSYSKITNVGIVMKARVYSSNIYENERYSMPTIGKEDLSLEDRNDIVMDMLPEFEKVFKENIVSYARTLRSLEKNQTIMFEVRLTECKGCDDFPKYMNFSINQDVLDQFNKGKLSFEKAVTKVSVEKRSI